MEMMIMCKVLHGFTCVMYMTRLKIVVQVWEFGAPDYGFGVRTYHTDVSFNGADSVAWGADRDGDHVRHRGSDEIIGSVVDTLEFERESSRSERELQKAWDKFTYNWEHGRGYSLRTHNCNHFTNACLKEFGFGRLPGCYFSRGEHEDKQVWNWVAQGPLGLSPRQADRVGREWCRARDDVVRETRNVVRALGLPW